VAEPFDAALEVAEFLSQNEITYVIIGGLAVQIWGRERLTVDADMTIHASLEAGAAPLVQLITGKFRSRSPDPLQFAKRNRLILIKASNGIDVDISLSMPGYEDNLFARAVAFELEPGKSVNLCSAEDLIIHKAVAGRPQDVIDIQGVVYRQGEKLDLEYIRFWLDQFSQLLENREVAERFESAWRKFQED
jgi:hypothetical protein